MTDNPEVPTGGEVAPDDAEHNDDVEEIHPIATAITTFVNRVLDIEFSVKLLVPVMADVLRRQGEQFREDIEAAEAKMSSDDPEVQIVGMRELHESLRRHDRLHYAQTPDILERALFVSLFTAFDAYSGMLLAAIYRRKSELFEAVNRTISVANLLKFSSLDDVREAVLELEIETFRRKSYVEQFGQLEATFGLKLTSFDRWPEFVECGQRRNLLTHADGRVSEQYVRVCSSVGYKTNAALGDKLSLGPEYFLSRCELLIEVGLKLGQTLWRKVLPDELEAADDHLHELHYRFLELEDWDRARILGEFTLSLPRLSSDAVKRLAVVNHAIALANSGHIEAAKAEVRKVDWSAASADFRLAEAVLLERFDSAAEIMRKIGPKGDYISESGYHTWPLFRTFRSSPEFQSAYADVFGYPYVQELQQKADAAKDQVEADLATSQETVEAPSSDSSGPRQLDDAS